MPIDLVNIEPGSTIAVVGASARAAAFSLLRAGYRVVAADLFADADLARQCPATRVSPYTDGFVDWLAKTASDGWIYTGALENYPELVDRLSVLRPLLGHSGEVLRKVRDPMQLQEVLHDAGLSFPDTVAGGSDSSAIDSHLIGKSYSGSSGSGVGTCKGAKFMQRRVGGESLAALFRGSQLIGVTEQLVGEVWVGADEYKYCGSIGPYVLPAKCLQELQRLGEVLNTEFGLTDLYGVDLMLDGKRLWTIEVNPRYTAAVEVLERVCPGFSPLPSPPHRGEGVLDAFEGCAGKVVLFAKAPLLIDSALHQQLMQQAGNFPWPKLADIPVPGTEIAIGQPILTLFSEADSCAAVAEQLQQRVIEIEKQLYGETFQCV